MPLSQLEKETKAAERDKYLAETEKIKIEKRKLEIEISKSGFWKLNTNIWTILSTAFITAAVFGFYYEYVGKSILEKDNIVNQLRNERQEKSLGLLKHYLDSDSLVLIKESKVLYTVSTKNDSLSKALALENSKFKEATSSINSLTKLLETSSPSKKQVYEANQKVKRTLKSLEKYRILSDSLQNNAEVAKRQSEGRSRFIGFEFMFDDQRYNQYFIYCQSRWGTGKINRFYPVHFDGLGDAQFNLIIGDEYDLKVINKSFTINDYHFKVPDTNEKIPYPIQIKLIRK